MRHVLPPRPGWVVNITCHEALYNRGRRCHYLGMAKDKEKEPIGKVRVSARIPVDAAAALFGVNRRTLLRWESGATPFPIERLSDAERIYNVSRQELRPDIFEAAQ